MAQINLADSVNLLICVGHVADVIHKPCVAVSVRILHGHCLTTLQGKDDVLRVEHVEDRIDRVACNACHVALRISYGRHHLAHFGSDVILDHLLITTQLGSVITADRLMIV